MIEIIDVHSHFYPRWYIDLLKARTEIPRVVEAKVGERFVIFPGEHGRLVDKQYWDLGSTLAFMELGSAALKSAAEEASRGNWKVVAAEAILPHSRLDRVGSEVHDVRTSGGPALSLSGTWQL